MTDVSHKPVSEEGLASRRLPPLYPIVDVDLCAMRGLDPLAVAQACLDGGARLLQLRRKGSSAGSGALLALTRAVLTTAGRYDAKVIVNDRTDVAMMGPADGVHVGQQDLPADIVRQLLGPCRLIGVSTHTPDQVDEAVSGPADYVAVGPVFRTNTKDTGYAAQGLGLIRHAAGRGKPVVAIGGITLATAPEILSAGADSVAVISDILEGGQIAARVRAYLEGPG
ncbi:MAG TPA: thiamine phosphate synthase [Vicinamibacterales bacterium]|nr:thiamine phosphate synthase [Vicinamibacterales bacterium]